MRLIAAMSTPRDTALRSIALCAVLFSATCFSVRAQSSGPEDVAQLREKAKASQAIAFLRLRFSGSSVQLVSYQIKPGHLKSRRDNDDKAIKISVTSTAGELLWRGSVENPVTQSFEWEASDAPGTIRHVRVDRAVGDVVVRVPVMQENQLVRFAGVSVSPDGKKAISEIGIFQLKTK